LALEPEFSSLEKSKFVVVPVAFEKTTSYRKGTYWGPKKFLEASKQLEFYDEELNQETVFTAGVATLPILVPNPKESTEAFFKKITATIDELLAMGKFVITVGGEHTLTFAPVASYVKRYPNLTILHFDAHADLRQSYEDTVWSHACALRRSMDVAKKAVLVGVRSLDRTEVDWIEANKNRVTVFLAQDCQNMDKILPSIIERLGPEVYITVDVDGFDLGPMPGVGTPQPGGISWYGGLKLFHEVFKQRKVLGFDVLELAPIKGEVVSEFTAAKLAYRLMGYADKYLFTAPKQNQRSKTMAPLSS